MNTDMNIISVTTDRERDLTTFLAAGMISPSDIISVAQQVYTAHPTRLALWDFRAVTEVSISSDHITTIVHAVKDAIQLRTNPKTALVVRDSFGYGMGRMYELLSESEHLQLTVQAFYDPDEARTWLFSQ